ncbi:MAG: penicillin-insensitive murein endopeptidase [Candidatus Poribacteria bacterium]
MKFRNLVHLPDSPENYIKIGGTCNHHGPRNDNKHPNCRTPDNNHWGHDRAVAFLPFIAIQYRTRFPDDELLQINDIGLPSGGKFDIFAQWTGNVKHEYHRLGLDVDVRSFTIPVGNRREFEKICLRTGVFEVDLEVDPEHYHLYFWDPPNN